MEKSLARAIVIDDDHLETTAQILKKRGRNLVIEALR